MILLDLYIRNCSVIHILNGYLYFVFFSWTFFWLVFQEILSEKIKKFREILKRHSSDLLYCKTPEKFTGESFSSISSPSFVSLVNETNCNTAAAIWWKYHRNNFLWSVLHKMYLNFCRSKICPTKHQKL